MIKTIQSQPQYFLTFTDEEVASLGLQSGDEFECQPLETGGFLLKKKEKLEIELSEYPREILEFLIRESINKNVTIASNLYSLYLCSSHISSKLGPILCAL